MTKRILAALLATVILLTLAGCANKAETPAPDTTTQSVTTTAETTGTAESDTDTEHTEEKKNSTAEETKPAETTETQEPSESVTEPTETKPAETKPQTTEKPESESKPAETKSSVAEPKVEEAKPETKPTESESSPKQTEELPKETEPEVTEPPKVTEPTAEIQQPEVTEPEKESFTEADHKRIVDVVTAYAESYAGKGFTFEWKESMTFGWDVGYMGTPRVEYEGVDGVIDTLKYHIDLIYKTSTDPMYGITTEYMTYKVEQITVDGDLAYVVIYGG